MAFELPALPYAHSALAERGMSQETLELLTRHRLLLDDVAEDDPAELLR